MTPTLSHSADPTDHPPRPGDLPRTIGFFGGAAIMIGVTIGSGIFRTPTSIAGELGSPALILLLWAVGGVLSLCGALAYAELAAMFPHSGGVYVFLREGFGRVVAFVFGWTYLLITKPAAAAGIAIVFAEHLNPLLGVNWNPRVTTTVVLVALTLVNTFRLKLGAGVAIVLTALKMLALTMIVVLGVALMKGDAANLAAIPAPKSLLLALAPVMAAILWTYDGWSDIGSIAGEIKNPQRRLPLIYFAGTGAVIVLYLAVNAVYMWMVPLEEMRTTGTIAPLVMHRLFGPAGGVLVNVLILISTIGATHAAIITGARVTFAQARDGLLFRFLGHVHPNFATPAVALWAQLALSVTAIWVLQTFERMAGTFVFTMWIFYGLAAMALFALRRTRPDLPRPYRCWGYPLVPALFIAAAAVMTALSIWQDPRGTLPWIGLLVVGVPAYYLWQHVTRAAPVGDR
ncbi:MAG: APC family permease [Phycisphaerae bacterium]